MSSWTRLSCLFKPSAFHFRAFILKVPLTQKTECYQRTASVSSAVTIARSNFCSMKVQATNFFSQLIAAERAQRASSNIIWILKYARKDEFSNSPLLTGIHYITPRTTQKHEDFKRLLQSFPMAWIFSLVWWLSFCFHLTSTFVTFVSFCKIAAPPTSFLADRRLNFDHRISSFCAIAPPWF